LNYAAFLWNVATEDYRMVQVFIPAAISADGAVLAGRFIGFRAARWSEASGLEGLAALPGDTYGDALAATNAITGTWLSAVEDAGVEDVESAEKLALAAYQAGAFDLAQRWIARSSNAPVAQWIQAKLLLRAGKTGAAAAMLASVTKQLPVAENAAQHGEAEFADRLVMQFCQYDDEDVPARRIHDPVVRDVATQAAIVDNENPATRRGFPYVTGSKLEDVHRSIRDRTRINPGVAVVSFPSIRRPEPVAGRLPQLPADSRAPGRSAASLRWLLRCPSSIVRFVLQ